MKEKKSLDEREEDYPQYQVLLEKLIFQNNFEA